MKNKFTIQLSLLRNDQIIKINEKVLFEEFELQKEKELIFDSPIEVKGDIYTANESLVMHFFIKFSIKLPCTICNEPTAKQILIDNLYITKDLNEIDEIYDFTSEIKNACFLEIPSYVECNDNCSKRQDLKKYLKTKKDTYPFSNL